MRIVHCILTRVAVSCGDLWNCTNIFFQSAFKHKTQLADLKWMLRGGLGWFTQSQVNAFLSFFLFYQVTLKLWFQIRKGKRKIAQCEVFLEFLEFCSVFLLILYKFQRNGNSYMNEDCSLWLFVYIVTMHQNTASSHQQFQKYWIAVITSCL